MIVQYVRDQERKPFGCLVAIDKNKIGWSLCNTKLDTFSKDFGKQIAIRRAEKEPHFKSFIRHRIKAGDGKKLMQSYDPIRFAKEEFYKNIPEDNHNLKMETLRKELYLFEDRVDKYYKE